MSVSKPLEPFPSSSEKENLGSEPLQMTGGRSIDDRGALQYYPTFNPLEHGIKRMYIVENHTAGFIRAWHGHKEEAKWVMCIRGAAKVIITEVDMDLGAALGEPEDYVLSDKNTWILYIPPGYVNGFKNLTADTQLIFFSDKTVEESKDDDYRFEWNDLFGGDIATFGPHIWDAKYR